jgi:flavodoxin
MKNLVVFYSWTGNTKAVAKEICNCVEGDLLELREMEQRTMPFGFITATIAAAFGKKSKIHPIDIDVNQYDNIFIGTPIWAGKAAPAINTFLSKFDIKEKNVYGFATVGNSNANRTIKRYIENLVMSGLKVEGKVGISVPMNQKPDMKAIKPLISQWVTSIQREEI